ncbi:uncharacterized protein LOC117122337 [Anneissia japonica]|uniref:uncharacterized protein LOC117122337 n=1 Tax=Anneissia japonica TaxID=1529436 RepID=UPI001425685A|nr:uncharacterized protein LOC117122337 [Anneissia japonica]
MYNLSKGPCKINVQSRRGGYSQQLENNSEGREIKKDMNAQASPRPYFQATTHTQEHLANVKMLSDAWKKTEKQLNDQRSGKKSDIVVEEYVERGVDPSHKNLPNATSTRW